MTALAARFRFARDGFTLDVDLDLPSGVTGILGPSGAGKTTLLRLVAGLERCRDGDVQLGERVWQRRGERQFTPTHDRGIGFVFQEPSLFPHLDVRRNLAYGWKRTPVDARHLAFDDAVDLLDLANLMDRGADRLSGGERQRVAIARALLAGPELLCFDEPLANVDPEQRHDVLGFLERVPSEVAVPLIYVSHNREEVTRLADFLVLLRDGRVEASGPVASALTDLDTPLAHAGDAGVVLVGRIEAHDDGDGLSTLVVGDRQLLVSRIDRSIGESVRVRVAARDVSIALERAASTSILNILDATVSKVAPTASGQVTVQLQIGRETILARITKRSVIRLGLVPGRKVYAQIKGVAVVR